MAYQAVPAPFAALAPIFAPVVAAATTATTPVVARSSLPGSRVSRRLATRRRVATVSVALPLPGLAARPDRMSLPASVASRGQIGRASFYGLRSRTASGGRIGAATCAHRSLPFGTRVLVTNLANARSAVLTVNDRGPFVRGRIVDVSVGAAGMLGMLHSGTAPVRVEVVGGPG